MNYYKLGLGISLIVLTVLLFYYEIVFNRADKGDYTRYYFKIKIYTGIIVLFITGVILTYNSIFY